MQKNVASQKLIVFAFDATTNLPKTGDAANITAYVSKDYGSVTVLGDTSATEMDATNAKGYYLFDLTQAETNGNELLFSAMSSTSNIVVVGAPAKQVTVPANYSAMGIASAGQVGLDINNIAALTAGPLSTFGIVESGTAVSATATTLVLRAGMTADSIKAGMVLYVYDSTLAYWQSVMIDSFATRTATIAAWPIATPAATITYLVFGTPQGSAVVVPKVNMTQILGTAVSTPATAGILDANVKNINNAAAATPGAAGGVFIAGTNAATTVTTALTTTFTGNLTGTVAGVTPATAASILTTALTESYAADGAAGTLSQILFSIQAFLQERSVSGTTLTVKKLDGSTSAMTFTLSDATAPVSVTRAT